MRFAIVGVLASVLGTAVPASAQDPINVSVQVTELWRVFRDLYGPNGLVVNSNTPLASGATHSSHFNSGFESEFSQYGTALTLMTFGPSVGRSRQSSVISRGYSVPGGKSGLIRSTISSLRS